LINILRALRNIINFIKGSILIYYLLKITL